VTSSLHRVDILLHLLFNWHDNPACRRIEAANWASIEAEAGWAGRLRTPQVEHLGRPDPAGDA
jgi:hypothetical protein